MTRPTPQSDQGILSVRDEGAIRWVTLSNPPKRNALTRSLLQGADAAFAPPSSIRVVILRGDPLGGAFCAGFDISHIDEEERARGLDPIDDAAKAIEACTVPVIACIEGAAFGGGLELAMACTFRVATPNARFCMPPARLGLLYSKSGLERFRRALRPAQLQRLFLSAEVVSAERALSIGLVGEVCEDAEGSVRTLASQIVSNAPLSVNAHLRVIAGASDAVFNTLRESTLASEDLREGVRAFTEKRTPSFKGR